MLNDQDYELLSAYIDGALTETERAALETRLAAEDELRQELEALRETVGLIRALPERAAPRNFVLSRSMMLERRPPRRFVLSSTAVSVLSAVAAMLLITFSLFALTQNASPATPLTFAPAAAFLPTDTNSQKA